MKVVILAGGLGSRLAEETEVKPKPMVEIGGRPILWHIMKHYAHHGFHEFYIALGYKGEVIKRYFLDYRSLQGSLSVSLSSGESSVIEGHEEDWTVHLVDTGLQTWTGGRVKRLERWLRDETFFVTYGDGVCDIDLRDLLGFHRAHGRLATVTAHHAPFHPPMARLDRGRAHVPGQPAHQRVTRGVAAVRPGAVNASADSGRRMVMTVGLRGGGGAECPPGEDRRHAGKFPDQGGR